MVVPWGNFSAKGVHTHPGVSSRLLSNQTSMDSSGHWYEHNAHVMIYGF